MNKKIFFIKYFKNNKLFIIQLYITLLLFISKFEKILNEDNLVVNSRYPVALQLNNNHLFIANPAGMFFCKKILQ